MIFTETPCLSSFEKMMTGIPNFRPRGCGVVVMRTFEYTAKMCDCRLCLHWQKKKGCTADRCPCITERITAGAASLREVLTETMLAINNHAFRLRLKKYIRESEKSIMKYRSELHEKMFIATVRKQNMKDNRLMCALYLLTADCKLWNQVKRNITGERISFDHLKLTGGSENAYTFLCAAKDLYLGTKHLCVSDLADSTVISPMQFGIICNAMAIRRFGINVIQYNGKGGDRE